MWPIDRPSDWVGRGQELAILRAGIEALGRGEGTVVWVEGESGIGKSSLVAESLTAWSNPSWDIGWGMADKLTERLPLRAVLDCLQVRASSPDPRRAHVADLLRNRRLGLFADGDAAVTGIEMLVTLVDELCAAAPTVMVIDDLQWADEASLIVWHQLAASIDQMRLLLIATCQLAPRRSEVQQVRAAAVRRGDEVITLGPLAETEVVDLVTALLGSPPGDKLRQLTAQAAGNPLFVRELVDALVRERALDFTPTEVGVGVDQLPTSLPAVLTARLSSVPAGTEQMLRTAALLGGKFVVTDLAALARRPVSELATDLREATAAGILVASGPNLTFRHPLIQQALYESVPIALRTALHAEAARQLADTGSDVLSVAQQLVAAGRPGEGWVRDWLVQSAPVLATRAPRLAVDLLQQEVNQTPGVDEAWEGLMASLVRALLAAGAYSEAASRASQSLTVMTDPARRGETYSVLARALVSAGNNDGAITIMRQALAYANLPLMWQARMLAMLAMLERAATGNLDTADGTARRALILAEEAGDVFATAHALADLWLSHAIRRDHGVALDYIDRAMRTLGDDPGYDDLRSFAYDGRIFTLQNLARWPQAELTVREASESARRSGSPERDKWVAAAVLWYWLGRWDDALAELTSEAADVPGLTYSFLRERWPALLVSGVIALIAGRRDQRATASYHLRAGLARPVQTVPDRENQDFLVAAHALALEQSGQTRQAMLRLAGLMPRQDGEMTLLHQWLPDLVRLAIAEGDRETALAAEQACRAEATAETVPARAAVASLRCRGLLDSDPVPLREAVAHYRSAGPAVELPTALEDLAAVLAGRGREDEARTALNEAVQLYEGLHAHWDIRRAEGRLRSRGIRRGVRGPRSRRASSGWEALTPTEVKIASLVARGDSTSDIATGMFLSRRTVQTYISRILAKLGAKGRVEIVHEVLRQGISLLARGVQAFCQGAQASVGGGADGAGAFAHHLAGGVGVQADDGAQQHRLGLVGGQRRDQGQGRVGGDRLDRTGRGVVGGGQERQFLGGHRHRRRATALAPQVIERPVPADRGDPAAEAVVVAGEACQVPADLKPGLGRHVLGVVADQGGQVTQQPRLDVAVQRTERLGTALLCIADRTGKIRPDEVISGRIDRPAHPVTASSGRRGLGAGFPCWDGATPGPGTGFWGPGCAGAGSGTRPAAWAGREPSCGGGKHRQ
jgi:DNA-binding CsgD family transcriptional regulator